MKLLLLLLIQAKQQTLFKFSDLKRLQY